MKKFRLPSSPSGIILSFIAILVVYAALSLFIVPGIIFDDWSFFEEISDSQSEFDAEGSEISKVGPGELFLSFAASALQDILFFFITGIALLVYTIKRPEDDSLSQKLTYLFPQSKDDPVLKSYLEEAVNKLGCMSDKSSFVFTIVEFNKDLKSFKVQVHFESHLRNLHNKDSYSDPKLAMTLVSDLDAPPEGGLFGQLEHVKIHNFDSNAISDASDASHDYPVNMEEKVFKHSCPFTLPPHAIALFDAKHWDWSPEGRSHFLRVSRFTKSVKFRCINSCGHPITLETRKIQSDEEPQETNLDRHGASELSLSEVRPGGGVEVKILVQSDQ